MSFDKEKRHIAILGSTGSIGTQALEVIRAHPGFFEVEVLTANRNDELLIRQALEFKPNAVVICDETKYEKVKEALWPEGIKTYTGFESLEQVVEMEPVDMVLAAVVGYAGLKSTIRAIEAGKTIALANKETLVVAGDLITRLARARGVNIFPIDSEHSAIFQCITGEEQNPVEKIILTASGGPFRGREAEFLARATPKQALKHPNWEMGSKITIDSASLMNKGLEVIEAKWLFNLKIDQIDVVVHPQSIIHSIVQFEDSSMKAQMGLPDMRVPIQFALTYPNRLPADVPRFSFSDYSSLTFEEPDTKTFRNLALAFEAIREGGNMPCVLNAANEVAVEAFLKERLSFLKMSDVIEKTMQKTSFVKRPTLEEYEMTDAEARKQAMELIN